MEKKLLLIGGGTKCGTSLLFNALSKLFPQNKCCIKEPQFFSSRYNKGINWYLNLFDTDSSWGFEASTNYLYDDQAASRILEYRNNIIFLICLRDPLKRAISDFRMLIRTHSIDKSDAKKILNLSIKYRDRLLARSDIAPRFFYFRDIIGLERVKVINIVEENNFCDAVDVLTQILIEIGCSNSRLRNELEQSLLTSNSGEGFSVKYPILEYLRMKGNEPVVRSLFKILHVHGLMESLNLQYKQALTSPLLLDEEIILKVWSDMGLKDELSRLTESIESLQRC